MQAEEWGLVLGWVGVVDLEILDVRRAEHDVVVDMVARWNLFPRSTLGSDSTFGSP